MTPHICYFVEIDQRLYGLTLEIVVRKLAAGRQSMVSVEPVVKQETRSVADSFVPFFAPPFDFFSDARHERRSRDARFKEPKLIAVVLTAPSDHRYVTFSLTVFVVSLPRMSMTFTTTMYSPA